MPKRSRTRSHILEDLSRTRLRMAIEVAGWTVEDVHKDYGEDLLVRIFRDGYATPLLIFVQMKSTEHPGRYRRQKKRAFEFPTDVDHYENWCTFAEPVVLALWDTHSDNIYWDIVQEPTFPIRYTKKSGRPVLRLPDVLDGDGLRLLEARTRRRYERLQREREGARVLVEMYEELSGATVEYDAQGGLIVVDEPTGTTRATVFGELADMIAAGSERLGVTPERFYNGLMTYAAGLTFTQEDGQLAIALPQGTVTIEDFVRQSQRSADLREGA